MIRLHPRFPKAIRRGHLWVSFLGHEPGVVLTGALFSRSRQEEPPRVAYPLLGTRQIIWRARGDSNPQPLDPKSNALSD
jgi:hypothetical protein